MIKKYKMIDQKITYEHFWVTTTSAKIQMSLNDKIIRYKKPNGKFVSYAPLGYFTDQLPDPIPFIKLGFEYMVKNVIKKLNKECPCPHAEFCKKEKCEPYSKTKWDNAIKEALV